MNRFPDLVATFPFLYAFLRLVTISTCTKGFGHLKSQMTRSSRGRGIPLESFAFEDLRPIARQRGAEIGFFDYLDGGCRRRGLRFGKNCRVFKRTSTFSAATGDLSFRNAI